MKIQFIVNPKSGVSYHRLINPMEFMNWAEGDSAEMLWVQTNEHKIDCDILVYNKFIFTTANQLTQYQKKGMKIVVDIDDSWDLPSNHAFYDIWTKNDNTQKVIDNIKIADLVICATLKLQEKVRQYNKNTVVIPNAFPFGKENYLPNPQPRQKMSFIYVVGSTHLPDVELLRGKFKRMGSDSFFKDNAEFILAGYEEIKIPMYNTPADLKAKNANYTMKKVSGVWDKMVNVFSETNSHRVLPSTNLDEYINYYDQADVAIIPLCSGEWNSYKSELKVIEAAVKGIPVICSAVEPYSLLRPAEGIMWIDKPSDWIDTIKYCIKNPEYVKDMGTKLHNWVSKEYELIAWNKVRMELFKKLIETTDAD